MSTKISIDLECEKLIDGLDKSSAKVESFSKKADKSIEVINKSINGMSENQKRAYEAIKKSYENHLAELSKMSDRYEELRQKQKSGVEMTKSEKAELQSLLGRYKNHANAIITVSKELGVLCKSTQGVISYVEKLKSLDFKDAFSGFASTFAAIVGSKLTDWATDAVVAITELGLGTQKLSAQFGTMIGDVQAGEEIYRLFNDVARNTNYDQSVVMDMGKNLLNLGYSAQEAAGLITQCSDAASKLGMDAGGTQNLVDYISKIQTTGKLTVEQLGQLQAMGLDLSQVFSNMGMTAVEAVNGLTQGTVDSKVAIDALTKYMKSFDGAMNDSKSNIVDQWGDIVGNLSECCSQIGKFIADAFQKSDILKELIDFTQILVDMIRGEGCGAFTAFGKVVSGAFDAVGTVVKALIHGIELLILVGNWLLEGFTELAKKIYDKLSWLLEPLGKLYSGIKSILSALGEQIDAEFQATYIQPKATDAITTSKGRQTSVGNYVNGVNVHTQNASAVLAETDAYQQLNLVQKKVAETSQKVTENTIGNINWFNELTNSFSNLGSDILKNGINFMDGLSSAFQNFAESICNQLMNIYLKAMLVNAVSGLFGGGSKIISGTQFGLSSIPSSAISGSSFGLGDIPNTFQFLAGGGLISGPGTGTSDSIPAMLSNGEYVLNANAVKRIGIGNLDVLNSGGVKHFANGGYVGTAQGGMEIKFNLINETGTNMQATQQGEPKFDGEAWVCNVVMNAVATNRNGMRTLLQGAR